MEIIKRKILLEDSIDRTYNSPNWGVMTATTFYLNIPLTQTIDDMGLFTDMSYLPKGNKSIAPDYSVLTNKLSASGITFPFMSGIKPIISGTSKDLFRLPSSVESDYYEFGNLPITGFTDSKIEDVRSYAANNPFRVAFNTAVETYVNYDNVSVNGVNRIKSMGEPRIYVFDTPADINLGTDNQIYGLQYLDFTGETRQITIDEVINNIPITSFRYIGEGWNETNTSLSALAKEEYLFGIVSKPIVQSDVLIDRGVTTVMERHLRLSEINGLGHLSRYGNGFYNIITI
jgi:hypothetical protein